MKVKSSFRIFTKIKMKLSLALAATALAAPCAMGYTPQQAKGALSRLLLIQKHDEYINKH